MTFDPWDTTNTSKVDVAGKSFSPTLVARAEKRVDDVRRMSARVWSIAGDPKLGDKYPFYEVQREGNGEFTCSCYALNHGDARVRRGCSHVVAVLLYRERLGVGDGVNGKEVAPPPSTYDLQPERVASPMASATGEESRRDTTSRLIIPSVTDTLWTEWDKERLPNKFQEIHQHQWDAVDEAVEHFMRGVEVVFVDAPTGSGKSLIAELVRRRLKSLAFYICHSKTLQDQFAADFPYAKVLKGRVNYPTLDGPSDVTCADCTSSDWETPCMWCEEKVQCPYQVAKADAMRAKLAILNTSYFMTESNYVGQVNEHREFGIVDECDVLESELMGFVQFYLGERMLQRLGLRAPKEGSHKTTIAKWMVEELKPKLHEYGKTIRGSDVRSIRERLTVQRLMADVLRIGEQVEQDAGLEQWVRDNKAGPMVLKPVVVSEFGDRYVWSHAKRWLCMSATIISSDELADSCGLNGNGEGEGGKRWETVTVPMTFPVENRRIVIAPVADMSKKGREAGEWEHAATAIRHLCNRHPNERVLVHTVSYELARFIVDRVSSSLPRPIVSYSDAGSRDAALARFRRTENAVLVASSMDRGVDLADDDCRVVIVAKMPFPYLGDPQVNQRMHMNGGGLWYAVQTVRKLVQMTGRANRHKDDWSRIYIIDRQFGSNVWKKNRGLLPKWWRDAVDMTFNVRELMRE